MERTDMSWSNRESALDSFTFRHRLVDDEATIEVLLGDDLDAMTCPAVIQRIEAVLDGHDAERLVLDLDGVYFFDSTGIRLLLRLMHRQEPPNQGLVLRNVPGAVRRLLETTGLVHHLDIESFADQESDG